MCAGPKCGGTLRRLLLSKCLSLPVYLLVAIHWSASVGSAAEPSAGKLDVVVTDDNYGAFHRAIRDNTLDDDEASRVALALAKFYCGQSYGNLPLFLIVELESKTAANLDAAFGQLAEVLTHEPDDKTVCDLCDMLIRCESLPPVFEKALEERFSPSVTAQPPLSRFKEAAVLLKFKNNAEAREWLEASCRHEKRHIRVAAAHALGSVGKGSGQGSVKRLETMLNDQSAAVRTVAAGAVWKLTGNPEPVVPILVAATAEPAEAVILRPTTFSESGPCHRQIAVMWLGEIRAGPPVVLDCLLRLLRDGDPELRGHAADALGKIDDRSDRVRRSLEKLVEDEEPFVRETAARVLRQMSGEPE